MSSDPSGLQGHEHERMGITDLDAHVSGQVLHKGDLGSTSHSQVVKNFGVRYTKATRVIDGPKITKEKMHTERIFLG